MGNQYQYNWNVYPVLGAGHKVSELDLKKRTDSECAAFEFRTKKLSVSGVDHEILSEVHKLPYPIQKLVINELLEVTKRLEKGKIAPGLTSLDCHCLFHHRYLLPYFTSTYMELQNYWRSSLGGHSNKCSKKMVRSVRASRGSYREGSRETGSGKGCRETTISGKRTYGKSSWPILEDRGEKYGGGSRIC